MLLDRLIGQYSFADVKITGIADKHATDPTYATYDFKLINGYFGGQAIDPPHNSRCWDNCLIIVETGGLRILHWGDNRHNPPEEIWQALGNIDILLMPVDDSQHVMGNLHLDEVLARLQPRVTIPHHYYIWNVVQRGSTLLPVEKWLSEQPLARQIDGAETSYTPDTLPQDGTVDCFGDNVAFDVDAWHRANGMELG